MRYEQQPTPAEVNRIAIDDNKGHESSGTIVKVRNGITNLHVGQIAVVEPIIVGGICYSCKRRRPPVCDKLGWIGYSGSSDGMTDFVVVDKRCVHVISEILPLNMTVLGEPVAVAWRSCTHS